MGPLFFVFFLRLAFMLYNSLNSFFYHSYLLGVLPTTASSSGGGGGVPTDSFSFLGELFDSFQETGEQNEGAPLTPGAPAHVQEETSSSSISPSPESVQEVLRQRLIMEMEEMRVAICQLLRADFDKAESEFPIIADGLSRREALDRILSDIYIANPEARRGVSPDASSKELILYKRWLLRVLSGSKNWSESQPLSTRDLPLQGQIVPFYAREWAKLFDGG